MAAFKAIAKFTFSSFFGIIIGLSSGSPIDRQNFQCRNSGRGSTFELVKVYHQLSTAHLLEGELLEVKKDLNTIQLCIEACRQNPECHSLYYQQNSGCVLFKTKATPNFSSNDAVNLDMVSGDSAYYAQKTCLSGADRLYAGRPWAFDGEQLSERSKQVLTIKKRLSTTTGEICKEHCLNEKDFPCRLAAFSDKIKECILTNSQSVIDLEDPSSPSLFYYRANCSVYNLEKSLSSLENAKGKYDRSDYTDGISENIDKYNLNKISSNNNQKLINLKRLSGNSSRMMVIYAGIVVQLIAFMALFWYSCWKKNWMNKEKATLQVSFQIQNNDEEGQLQLPTYWEAVNIPSSDVEALSLNWEGINDTKVFYSEGNDPPPTYAEIIESTFATKSGNDSNNKENENSGDLPSCYN